MNHKSLKRGFAAAARFLLLRHVALLGLSVIALVSSPVAFAQSTGVIEGRVFNAASGNALINARVTLDGSTREAITDESGSYRISGVPAGTATLRVFYLGMESQTATVDVPAGGSALREFELQ